MDRREAQTNSGTINWGKAQWKREVSGFLLLLFFAPIVYLLLVQLWFFLGGFPPVILFSCLYHTCVFTSLTVPGTECQTPRRRARQVVKEGDSEFSGKRHRESRGNLRFRKKSLFFS
ncbi:hypothetical protein B0T19DRAFT_15613 [Cercophora scortea]|uniref:Uncharacterized protein n=1 Tax=Cercophora scortea TaxID=314031 RepID=A0AAE0J3R3_9PEZI|nr:hypothetical protein B0T19DRAFT_15613 [Cercophora scortea]